MLPVESVFNSNLDFKVFIKNNKDCLVNIYISSDKKVVLPLFDSRLFLGAFYAKMSVFMARVLVLSIKFSSSCITCF